MAITVPRFSQDQVGRLTRHAREVVSYRKNDINRNHIPGAPAEPRGLHMLACGRDQRQQPALLIDAKAVEELVRHQKATRGRDLCGGAGETGQPRPPPHGPPTAVVVVRHTVVDVENQPLECAEAVSPPNRWTLRLEYPVQPLPMSE